MNKSEIAFRISQFSRPPVDYPTAMRVAETLILRHDVARDLAEADTATATGEQGEVRAPDRAAGGVA